VNENGPDGNISYVYGATLLSAAATGFQNFYQFDGLGSVATVTDQTGSPKASYAYDPWGTQTVMDPLGTKNKYKFTGEPLDPSTGLVFLRARFYDPRLGRFLSPDSASGPLQVGSTYLYTLANPLRFVDPSGHGVLEFLAKLFNFARSADALSQQNQDAWNCVINDPLSCDFNAAGRTISGVEQKAAQQAAGVAMAGADVAYSVVPGAEFEPGTTASQLNSAYNYVKTASDLYAAGQALRHQPSVPAADSPYQAGAQGPPLSSGALPVSPNTSPGYSPPKKGK
jgi:RHS repeat-associated protein